MGAFTQYLWMNDEKFCIKHSLMVCAFYSAFWFLLPPIIFFCFIRQEFHFFMLKHLEYRIHNMLKMFSEYVFNLFENNPILYYILIFALGFLITFELTEKIIG